MIKLNGGGLFQWDIDREITITDIEFDELHFDNIFAPKALVTKPANSSGGIIPNVLLQFATPITVYAVKNEKVLEAATFEVTAKAKPEDYEYINATDIELIIDESGLIESGTGVKEKVKNLIDLAGIYAMIQQGIDETATGGYNLQSAFAHKVWQNVPPFDYSNITDLTKLCYNNSSLTTIEFKNTHNVITFSNVFTRCTNLKEVIGLDLSGITKAVAPFSYCAAIEKITVIGEIPITLDFKYATLLDIESAKNIILALKNYAGTEKEYDYTITFASEVWALLDAEGNTAPHGGTWQEYAYNVLKWNV